MTHRPFNLIVTFERTPGDHGNTLGRAVAESAFTISRITTGTSRRIARLLFSSGLAKKSAATQRGAPLLKGTYETLRCGLFSDLRPCVVNHR
jgi:hypothetical protein